MTKAASSNSLEQVSPESPSCSTSTSSTEVTEVYNSPLGQGGGIYVNDEKLDFDNIRGLAFPSAAVPTIQMTNTDGVNNILNTSVDIKTGGPTTINFVAPAQEPNENGLHKNGSFFQTLKRWRMALIFLFVLLSILMIFLPFISESDDFEPTIPSYVNRSMWQAMPAKSVSSQTTHLICLVIITQTGGPFCTTFSECVNEVQKMQNHDIQDMPDIKHNFFVGGDGRIYEGRGWGVNNEWLDDTINIAFIGNFSKDEPSEEMLSVTWLFLEEGHELGHLHFSELCVKPHVGLAETGEHLFSKMDRFSDFSDECSAITIDYN